MLIQYPSAFSLAARLLLALTAFGPGALSLDAKRGA